jgi:hypothetical protein
MRVIISVLMLVCIANLSYAQLPSKIKKMEGVWDYKLGSGFEVLEVVGDELVGVGYRVNRKTGDTTRVENNNIQLVNKNLMYTLTTYNVIGDSVSKTVQKFIADGKKMTFRNISNMTPYSIEFKMGLLSRNKLRMSINYGPNEDPVHLYLTRKKSE